jgi:hypothetical protein
LLIVNLFFICLVYLTKHLKINILSLYFYSKRHSASVYNICERF